MEFAVCPVCKQSVLDDDAEECPFCGASMKGGPNQAGAKKPAPKPAAPAVAASPSRPAAAAPAGGPKRPVGKSSADDDLPFETESPAATENVTQVSVKPTKSRTYEVKCPMCETVGYIPPSAAGTRVKCANLKCLVPLFTAPAIPVEKPPEEPPRKPNYLLLGGVTTAICLIGGAIAYVLFGGPPDKPMGTINQMTPEEAARLLSETATPPVNPTPATMDQKTPTPDKTPAVSDNAETEAANAANAKFVKDLQTIVDKAVLIGQGPTNRSRPFCRMLAAETYALAGDIPGAREQLVAFDRIGKETPFYRIPPYTEIAWAELRAKQADAAKASAGEGLKSASTLPGNGRPRLIYAGRLAAALIATGDTASAAKLAADYNARWGAGFIDPNQNSEQTDRSEGEVAAVIQEAIDQGDLNIAAVYRARPAIPWSNPQPAAIAWSAGRRAPLTSTVAWIEALPKPLQPDAYGELAGVLASSGKYADAEALAAALGRGVASLSEDAKGFVLARAATIAATAGKKEMAASCAAAAATAAPQTAPEPVKLGSVTEIMNRKGRDWRGLERTVRAWAEIALAQSLLQANGPRDAALDKLVAFTTAIGVSLQASDAFLNELNTSDAAAYRDRLKTELKLKNDDQARRAYSDYRRKALDLRDEAAFRYDLERTAFARLVEAGAGDWIAATLERWDAEREPALKQTLRPQEYTILNQIVAHAKEANQAALISAITEWTGQSGIDFSMSLDPLATARAAVATGKPADAVAALKPLRTPDKALATLVLATGWTNAPGFRKAVPFIEQTDDANIREEGAMALGAQATVYGLREDALQLLNSGVNRATERIAWCRGLLTPQPPTPPAPANPAKSQ